MPELPTSKSDTDVQLVKQQDNRSHEGQRRELGKWSVSLGLIELLITYASALNISQGLPHFMPILSANLLRAGLWACSKAYHILTPACFSLMGGGFLKAETLWLNCHRWKWAELRAIHHLSKPPSSRCSFPRFCMAYSCYFAFARCRLFWSHWWCNYRECVWSLYRDEQQLLFSWNQGWSAWRQLLYLQHWVWGGGKEVEITAS